jgi:small glutamine-rich tetratricopeptide repeat-containing protein alpha
MGDKAVVYLFLKLLADVKDSKARADASGLSGDAVEQLTIAGDCLGQAFGIDMADEAAATTYGCGGRDLAEIVAAGRDALGVAPAAPAAATATAAAAAATADDASEAAVAAFPDLWAKWVKKLTTKGFFEGAAEGTPDYDERMAKAKVKFAERMKDKPPAAAAAAAAAAPAAPAAPAADDGEAFATAEALKAEGNTALMANDFAGAKDKYLAAHAACPGGKSSHIYLANLAAAQCHLDDYDGAVDACTSSIALKDDYAKSHSRLGLAHFHLGNYAESADAYARAVELDGGSKLNSEGLAKAKAKLTGGGGGGGGGMPPGMPAGLASMMNNPAMAQMAEQMRGAGGPGGGGPPDMGAMMGQMMSNPAMMQMAQQVMSDPSAMQGIMGMMGGMGGAGGGAPGGMPDLSALAGMMGGGGGMPGGPGGGMPDMAALQGMMAGMGGPPAGAPAPAPAPGATDADGNLEVPATYQANFN